ncbi:hypothetical protein H5410_039304 [Solanum commersonii]|uniref:Uncharacterized protein n=1 Tax=Solanum commersonii TaxID=4109 RepID=A0A9J5YEM5_SOLCO|nr:hypothetical protein H5410_039304 [Solanum commersonii]
MSNEQQIKDVSELKPTYQSTHVDTEANDPKKCGEAHQVPQDFNELIMDQDDSSTSTTISPSTQAAIDALIKDLGKVSIPAKPLCVYDPQDLTGSQDLLSDSQLSPDIPTTEIVVRSDSKTPAPRNKMPSRIIQMHSIFGSTHQIFF